MWKNSKKQIVKEVENVEVENENVENENVEVENNEAKSEDFHDKIQNTSIWRVKVVAKYNHGSFDKGCEYEVSKKVLELYNGIFDVL